jgi:hypothetical protein
MSLQDRPYARNEFADIKRFGKIVICSGFQTGNAVLLVTARREHDDGDFGHGPQFPKQQAAIATGQHHVQHDQVMLAFDRVSQTVLCVVGEREVEAIHLQQPLQRGAEFPVVVDEKDPDCGREVGVACRVFSASAGSRIVCAFFHLSSFPLGEGISKVHL